LALKKVILPDDPYGSDITLLWGTRAELNAFLRKELEGGAREIRPESFAHTTEWTANGHAPVHYVSIVKRDNRTRVDRLAALAHELIHVTLGILEFRGLNITTENDEAVAYYYEWLFRHCAAEVW
jgi:hypothetical protein